MELSAIVTGAYPSGDVGDTIYLISHKHATLQSPLAVLSADKLKLGTLYQLEVTGTKDLYTSNKYPLANIKR